MKKTMTMTSEILVRVPRVPDFLLLSESGKVSVGSVSDDYLREVGKEWTEDLIRRANEQRTDWPVGKVMEILPAEDIDE